MKLPDVKNNIFWNFIGLGIPLFIAALIIPSLIKTIGTERFGLLSLAWGLIGFSGVFDFGIGRATTQMIARLRGSDRLENIPYVIKVAKYLSFCSGLIGMLFLCIVTLFGYPKYIKYSSELYSEVIFSCYIMAFVIPLQSMSAMFRGVNEAFDNFKKISFIRIILGAVNFLGPFCAAKFTTNIAILISTLFFSRLIAFFLFQKFAWSCVLKKNIKRDHCAIRKVSTSDIISELFLFGKWITITNVVYPLIMQSDRFLIGYLLSARYVADYVVPYEIVIKSLFLIGSITTVLFPKLTILVHSSQREETLNVFYRWLFYVVIAMLLLSIILIFILPYALFMWLGKAASVSAVLVGQILCIGLVPYTIGTMYVAIIHAYSRSDITGKVHLLQSPFYFILLYWMIKKYGIQGAAWCWVIRAFIDTFLVVGWFSLSTYEK